MRYVTVFMDDKNDRPKLVCHVHTVQYKRQNVSPTKNFFLSVQNCAGLTLYRSKYFELQLALGVHPLDLNNTTFIP